MAKYFRTVVKKVGSEFETTTIPFTEEEETQRDREEIEFMWELLRKERNERLTQSDIWVMPDRWIRYSPEKQTEISDYRQALRDLPENTTDPFNVNWPTLPEL